MVIYGDCCLESAGYLVRGLWEHMLRWSMMIWRNWVKLSHMSKFQNPVTGLYWPILKKHVRKNCLQMKQLFSCSEFKNSLSRSFRNGIFQFGFPVFSSATTPNTRLLSVEKSTETCPLAWKDLEGSGRIWKGSTHFLCKDLGFLRDLSFSIFISGTWKNCTFNLRKHTMISNVYSYDVHLW